MSTARWRPSRPRHAGHGHAVRRARHRPDPQEPARRPRRAEHAGRPTRPMVVEAYLSPTYRAQPDEGQGAPIPVSWPSRTRPGLPVGDASVTLAMRSRPLPVTEQASTKCPTGTPPGDLSPCPGTADSTTARRHRAHPIPRLPLLDHLPTPGQYPLSREHRRRVGPDGPRRRSRTTGRAASSRRASRSAPPRCASTHRTKLRARRDRHG